MNCRNVHSVRPLGRGPQTRSGGRTLCTAGVLAILFASPLAKADCPAAPLTSTDDMVVSFLAGQGGTQAAPSTQFASSVKEGMLVYDDTNNALKVCNGTAWQTLTVGGGSVTAAGTVAGAVQFRGATGNLEADDVNFVWDDTNNRLGIGTASPTVTLDVVGSAQVRNSTSSTQIIPGSIEMLRNETTAPNVHGHIDFKSAGSEDFDMRVWYDGTNNELKISNGATDGFLASDLLTVERTGNLGIGTASPNASALIDITSTTKGFLPPRMTTAEATGIATPADGLMVYDTDTDTIKLRANGAWIDLLGGSGSEADPQVGTITANKWCSANAGGTAIDCTADAPATGAAGTASEVQFRNSGTGAFAANSNFVWDDTNARLGINIAAPTSPLHVSNGGITADAYGYGGVLILRRANGTASSPTGVAAGENFSVWAGRGYTSDGAFGGNSGLIHMQAEEAFSSTALGSAMLFSTTLQGTATPTEKMRIMGNGNVGIGTASPSQKLDVQTATGPNTEAIRVISGSTAAVWVAPHVGAGSWNGISQSGDQGLYFQGTGGIGTGNLVIAPWASATSEIRITSGGNVGIGTASPASKLQISADGSNGTAMSAVGTLAINSVSPQINFNDTDHADWAIHANSNKLFFIREPWNINDLVLDGAGSIGMGTNAPNASALLDLTSTTKGFLPPRMTTAQRDAIASPAIGLLVFNTTAGQFQFWNGSAWMGFSGSGTYFDASLSSQSIPNTGWTTVVFNTQNQDVGGDNYNPATGVFTAPAAGFYQFNATTQGGWLPTADLTSMYITTSAGIICNGSTGHNVTSNSLYGQIGCSGAVYLTAGQTAQVVVWQNTGAARNFSGRFSGFLATSGAGAGGGIPGGSTTQVQFNDGGAFGGDTSLIWDKTNKRLGIGAASPGAPLSFAAATGAKVHFYDSTAGNRVGIGINAAELQFFMGNSNHFSFNKGGDLQPVGTNELMRIDAATGNVGIGTASPGAKLQVVDGGGASEVAIGMDSAAGINREIAFTTANTLRWVLGANNAPEGGSSAGSDLYLNAYNDAGSYLSTPLFVRRSTGNVGIGTATPSAGLHVHDRLISGTGAYGLIATTSNQYAGFGMDSGTSSKALVIHFGDGNDLRFGRYANAFGGWEANPYRFDVDAPESTIVATEAGSVGIGTASPSYKLDVAGNINSTGWYYFTAGLPPAGSSTLCSTNGGGPGYMGYCTSDRRLKDDIRYLNHDEGLKAVMNLKPARFRWKNGDQRLSAGFIAQDAMTVIPEAVFKTPSSEFYGFDINAIISYSVKAIQELKADNDNLRAELAAIGSKSAADKRAFRQQVDLLKAANDEQESAIYELRRELRVLRRTLPED